jgi:hypothetical protein
MSKRSTGEDHDDAAAQKRFEAALKGAMSTSPKPLKDKPKVKRAVKRLASKTKS